MKSEENKYTFDHQISETNKAIQNNKCVNNFCKFAVSRTYDIDDNMYQGTNIWLIKPNDFNRGRGVRLFRNFTQLKNIIKEFYHGNEVDFYLKNVVNQI